MKKTAILFCFIFMGFYAHSLELKRLFNQSGSPEKITISGIVKDLATGETLPFANVFVVGTNNGTTTNIDGYFTLFDVPVENTSIRVKYIGYEAKTIKVASTMANTNIEIFLTPTTEQLDEVVLSAETEQQVVRFNKKVSQVALSPKELASIPNLGEKDIFRALQLLPGVSGTNESSAGLYVRGGTPDQNLILLDGFTVYHVDHFYGFFSAFNSEALKDIQLYKGGFPAEFGGRISSIMELTGKTGNNNKFTLSAGASLLSANIAMEIPLGKKANLLIAGRRSYTDIIQSGLYQDIFDLYNDDSSFGSDDQNMGGDFQNQRNETEPTFHFYDLNAKLSYRPSDQDIISLSLYNGEDNLDNSRESQNTFGQDNEGSVDTNISDVLNWGNLGSSLRWARKWNEKLYTKTIVAYSNYFSKRDRLSDVTVQRTDSTTNSVLGIIEDNELKDLTARLHAEYQINSDHMLEFGGQYTSNQVKYDYIMNDSLEIITRDNDGNLASLFVQDNWSATSKLDLLGGIRVSHFDITEEIYYEPRISGTYQLSDEIKLKAAWGKYYQFVNRIVREDVTQGSRDFWLLANDETNPISSSEHRIFGISYENDGWLLDVEYFEKDMTGLSEFSLRFQSALRSGSDDQYFFEGTGIARGVEFLLQKKVGAYTGWLGYTLSEVVHTFPDISDNPYYALHDQRHELKWVNMLKIGKWDLGATWVYGSGKPYTAPDGEYTITLLDGTTYEYVSVGDKNGLRLPPYHRLDLSATYSFKLGGGTGNAGLSLFNLYNRTNIWYKEFEVVEDNVIETNVNYIGFTPSIFFNVKF
ncbi:TonB-dependent receptor [Muricauda sp. 334s03]|uniref:TonB-dependent receptor n=1 Tax=Flagellimonas yonaguniensis TaxID=3031325 RepID=A0ABT5XWQ5_9FLAO|nr:TonB-dependent receptor [[Muricauda] yonaguniensis]MDF0715622.1 TonB-dependent receptor [[Muricauda] yonaguniensis]